tara:strand:- start:237 stop:596 length:360 start_codon:yes stop_codon:yes gene_type:complete
MNTINKDEILKSSKWIRFLYMILYVLLVNFIVLPVAIALSFIQFLFVLFISQPNKSITNVNKHIIEFFNDSISFLLFQTEEKPFPFKSNEEDEASNEEEVVIDGEAEEIPDESSEQPGN